MIKEAPEHQPAAHPGHPRGRAALRGGGQELASGDLSSKLQGANDPPDMIGELAGGLLPHPEDHC